jgi:hypothetical protein
MHLIIERILVYLKQVSRSHLEDQDQDQDIWEQHYDIESVIRLCLWSHHWKL